MATNKRPFTLRLEEEIFDRIGALATAEHRSMTNYIEFVLLKYLRELDDAEEAEKAANRKPEKNRFPDDVRFKE